MAATQKLTIEIDTKGNVKGIKNVDKSLTTLGKRTSKFGSSLKSGMLALGSFGVTAGAALGAAAAGATVFAVKSAADIQQMRVSIDSMLGSAEKGQKVFGELTKVASKTPFQLEDLASATKTLIQYGSTAEGVVDEMRMLGDVAMGNKENFQSLSLAFGQVQAKGKLTGEEVRQMVNAGFNPLKAISEKTGVSMEELEGKMRKGEISFQDVKQSMVDATSEGGKFFEGMEKGSKTVGGLFSTLKDTIGITARKIIGLSETGDVIEGSLFQRIQEGLPKVIDFANSLGEKIPGAIDKVIEKIGPFAEKISNMFGNIDFNVVLASIVASFQKWFDILMILKPSFDSMVSSVMLMKDALVEFWETNEGWLLPTLKTIGTVLAVLYGVYILSFIKTIQWTAQIITNVLLPAFQSIINAIVNYVIPTFKAIGDFLSIFLGPAISIFSGIFRMQWEMIKMVFVNAWNLMKTSVTISWNFIKTIIKNGLNIIKGAFTAATQLLQGNWKGAWNTIKGTVSGVMNSMKGVISGSINSIVSLFSGLGSRVASALSNLGGIVKNAVSGAVRGIPGVGDKVADMVGLANGGVARGGQPYLVGENPDGSINSTTEAFVPGVTGRVASRRELAKAMGSGGGSTINNTFNIQGSDPYTIAQEVARIQAQQNQSTSLGLNPMQS